MKAFAILVNGKAVFYGPVYVKEEEIPAWKERHMAYYKAKGYKKVQIIIETI